MYLKARAAPGCLLGGGGQNVSLPWKFVAKVAHGGGGLSDVFSDVKNFFQKKNHNAGRGIIRAMTDRWADELKQNI